MTKKIKILISLTIITIILMFIGYYIGIGVKSKQEVFINHKNIETITFYNQDNNSEIITLDNSETLVTLPINKDIRVEYIGSENYANGSINLFTSADTTTINIDPVYSRDKLNSLLTRGDLLLINNSIEQLLGNNNSLYKIETGRLFNFGDWYGTTLKYVGSDIFNSDTLRIILMKEGSTWKVVTKIPDITLDRFSYPEIPLSVLSQTNKL